MTERIRWWRYLLRERREAAVRWVAWRLPRQLVMWCAIRVIANATSGPHRNQVVPDLTAMDALGRWH